MNLLRRELKFQIPLSLVDPICSYLSAYCEIDKFSGISPTGYYKINSLYLDTDDMYLLECKRRNYTKRFSMRIRSYGDHPTFPAYLELKNKNEQFVHKIRAPITCSETVQFLQSDLGPSNLNISDLKNPTFNKIHFEIIRRNLRPRIMTQYQRKAYFGLHESYSRVTFDRALRCYGQETFDIFPNESSFMNYDHDEIFVDQRSGVVLELKCEDKVPNWMSRLIKIFELQHSQFSKYDSSWTFLTETNVPY